MPNLYRVYIMLGDKRIMSTLHRATSATAAIAKAQKESVKIRSTGKVAYTACLVTTA